MGLSIRKLTPNFAAEVAEVELSPELDDAIVAELRTAMNEFAVLVFRDQDLTDDEALFAFGARFGDIAPPRNHRIAGRLKRGELADISNLDLNGEIRKRDDSRRLDALANQLWHSDASFRVVPGAHSMLYAHTVPPKGGDTEFADLRAAYDTLDDELRGIIEELVVEHSIFHSRGLLGHTDYTDEERRALPPVHHSLVRSHPDSKRKSLYMGSHASHIVGWSIPDGRLLLRELMDHATEQRFVYRHRWQVGDLVVWDNRCTLHRGRRYDDLAHKRDLRRVTTMDTDNKSAVAVPAGAGR